MNEVSQQLMHDKEHEFEHLWDSAVSSTSSNDDFSQSKRIRVDDEDDKKSYLTLY